MDDSFGFDGRRQQQWKEAAMRLWIIVITFTLVLRRSMSVLLINALSKDAGLLLRLILASDQNITAEDYGGKIDTKSLIKFQSEGFSKFIRRTRSLAKKRFKGKIPKKLREKLVQAKETVDKFRKFLHQNLDSTETDSKTSTRAPNVSTIEKKKRSRHKTKKTEDFADDY
ncbi:hypothetical protein GE061_007760 [Apolygus lucorum]|uniref:Uncharacterized protein n=1 Tax=Apolygus lucorum TaxID=248454 RepID=A0A6A4J385_APOLU|nr:hypothetical protein GE061_007755 [Apolygus lucorum]KAF6198015.1 hypothetical protein GE061_007760 [Apolygus lucorum]